MAKGKLLHGCSFAFFLSPVIIFWGLCVLGTSLGSLAVTTSYLDVFPFGAPLWSGSLFVVLGCFMVVAYRPSDQILASSSKAQVWFILVASICATFYCLVALGVSVWYTMVVSPVLNHCTPSEYHTGQRLTQCECTSGFIDPPSLKRNVYHFDGVSDCGQLREMLSLFQNVLLGLYSLGVLLAILVSVTSSKKLYSLGVCGKSGVYVVTPEPSPPTPTSPVSRQHSFSSSHPSHAPIYAGISFVTQRRIIGDSPQGSPSTANQSPAISGISSRPHPVNIGPTHAALI